MLNPPICPGPPGPPNRRSVQTLRRPGTTDDRAALRGLSDPGRSTRPTGSSEAVRRGTSAPPAPATGGRSMRFRRRRRRPRHRLRPCRPSPPPPPRVVVVGDNPNELPPAPGAAVAGDRGTTAAAGTAAREKVQPEAACRSFPDCTGVAARPASTAIAADGAAAGFHRYRRMRSTRTACTRKLGCSSCISPVLSRHPPPDPIPVVPDLPARQSRPQRRLRRCLTPSLHRPRRRRRRWFHLPLLRCRHLNATFRTRSRRKPSRPLRRCRPRH